MQDTGFQLGQYVINNVGWTNVNNILINDGSYAAATPVTGQASEFVVGGFPLNVPVGALISGIEVKFNGYRGIDTLPATSLEIWAYDNTNSNNAYYQLLPVFTDFDTVVGTFVLGGQSYTFNTVLDYNQVNNLKFKIIVNGEVYLDSVQVRAFYQPAVEVVEISTDTCTKLLQCQPFYLETPIGSTDTTCIVNKFVTVSGAEITTADIPNGYPAVLDQGQSNEENIIITQVSVLSGDRRQLTISRGWSDRDPVGQDSLLRKAHGAGAELTLSNNIEFYDQFLRKCHIGSLVSAPITFRFNGSQIASYVRDINAVGSGVIASAVSHAGPGGGQDITLTINGNNTVPPVVNGSSSGTSGNNQVNTLTYNTHAITGTDRLSVVSVSIPSTVTVSTITLGGASMTKLSSNDNGSVRDELWYKTNPALGVQPVLITLAASATAYITSTQITFNGTDQSGPIVLGSTNDGSDNNSEGSATTTINNSLILHSLATAKPSITYTAGTGESLVVTSLTGQTQSGMQTLEVGSPSTQTSTINMSQNATWANILAVIKPTPVTVITGQTNIQFQDEGVNLGTSGTVDTVNVTGTGATASRVGNTLTINVPGGVGSDEQVKVSNTDTTTGFLDNKITIVNGTNTTVTKTILNPGANEQIEYRIDSTGGSSNIQSSQLVEDVINIGTFGNFSDVPVDYNNQDGCVYKFNYVSNSIEKIYKTNSYGVMQPLQKTVITPINPDTGFGTTAPNSMFIYNGYAYIAEEDTSTYRNVKFIVIDLSTGLQIGHTNIVFTYFAPYQYISSFCCSSDGRIVVVIVTSPGSSASMKYADFISTLLISPEVSGTGFIPLPYTGAPVTWKMYKKTKSNTNFLIANQAFTSSSSSLGAVFDAFQQVLFWGTTLSGETICGRIPVSNPQGNPSSRTIPMLLVQKLELADVNTGNSIAL